MAAQPPSEKLAINNVRFLQNDGLSSPTTIAITNNKITFDPSNATSHIDAQGCTLLPGLIESHVHLGTLADLQALTSYGVTTAFQLATFGPKEDLPFYGQEGLTEVHYATTPAAKPGSIHSSLVQRFNTDPALLVQGVDDVERWLGDQVKWEPEFVKVVAQTPGLDQEALDKLVADGHKLGKKVVCHAADLNSHRQAAQAKFDQIHHVPADMPVDEELAQKVKQQGQISIPTLSIMKALASGAGPPGVPRDYAASRESVRRYHEAGVPILAGSDANNAIASVPFGRSLHEELELLVEAGLSPVEALRAATEEPARYWGLEDRGKVGEGMRADLVLVEGDPTVDIKDTRKIRMIWVGEREYEGELGKFDDESTAP